MHPRKKFKFSSRAKAITAPGAEVGSAAATDAVHEERYRVFQIDGITPINLHSILSVTY